MVKFLKPALVVANVLATVYLAIIYYLFLVLGNQGIDNSFWLRIPIIGLVGVVGLIVLVSKKAQTLAIMCMAINIIIGLVIFVHLSL